MKKSTIVILLSTILIASLTCVYAFCEDTNADTPDPPVSPGPAPNSGDGIPSGNQYIQPDTPGDGPAPNSGDGDPDGSGF